MNERFKELAVQAGFQYNRYEGYGWAGASLPKFAELIVRECASMARVFQNNEYDFTGDLDLDEFMLKHFGVEERKGWVCPKCGVDRTRDVCPKGHFATMTGDCPMTATAQSGVE
jgi:hypothetical protein